MYDELTKVDIKKMEEELEYRKLVLRPQILDDVKTARAFGDLSENFEYKEAKRAKGNNDAQVDEDFINALEYGLPPTGGLGMGLDRFVMLLTDSSTIRDVILFPTMKPKK